jgi:hypothetical protein
MLKNVTQFEIEIEKRIYRFLCDPDSPIEHAKESIFQFLKKLGQIEDALKQQQPTPPCTETPLTEENHGDQCDQH